MLLTLLKMRLASLFIPLFTGKKKKRGAVLTLLAALLMLFALVYFAVIFGALFAFIGLPLFEARADYVYFALGGSAMLLLMLLGSVMYTKSQLFAASDNELLLSMPIPPHLILISRLLLLFILNLLLEALIALPMTAIWLLFGHPTVGGMAAFLLFLLLLPLFALSLSAALAFLITRIGSRIRKKSLVTMLLSLGFLALYFFLISGIDGLMERLSTDIVPLIAAIDAVPPLAVLGRAMLASPLDLLLALPLLIGVILLTLYILSRTYLKTALARPGERHAVYRERTVKVRSPLAALTARELSRLLSSAGYMLNAGLGLLLMLIPPILLLINADTLAALSGELPELHVALPAVAATVGMLMTGMVFFSAATVSLEGRALWVIRTSPVPTRTVLLSKLLLHLIPTAPVAALTSVLYAIAIRASLTEGLALLLLSIVFVFFSAELGLIANLLLPKLEWKNEIVPVKQGAATLVAMLGSIVAAMMVGSLSLLLSFLLPPSAALLLTALLLLGGSALLSLYLLRGGVRRFESL